jgi:dTDP-4-amino-4,6-dideoxygalactose transaminase
MGGLEISFIKEAFDTNWIAPLGPNVDLFEKEISELIGTEGAVALSSGTGAMHLALRYICSGEREIVFCSALTFAASCNPIVYEGAEPVFIDSEPESWNMSPIALKKALVESKELGKLPKAVIAVNLYGQSADIDPIRELCEFYKVPLIEDAAESLGATYKGKYSGTFGEFGIYSFNGNKIITTSGGGMVVSNNKQALDKIRFWATQSRDAARHYEHTELGFNYRMSNVLAGIGRGQLRVLKERLEKKKSIYDAYKQELSNIEDIEFMPVCKYGEPNYWLTAVTIKESSCIKPLDIILALEKENIESRPIWKPMQQQPYYKNCRYYSHYDNFSVSEDIFNRGLCLPSDTKMTDEDIFKVTGIIKELFLQNKASISA